MYTDVHSTARVSPEGVTRGPVAPGEVNDIDDTDTDDDDVPTSSSPSPPTAPASGDDGD